jgi:hypothetical protein
MMMGRKTLGLHFLSRTFVKGSKTEYDTKKMESVALYWPGVRCRSLGKPSTLALPMFVRSRKEMRYRNESCWLR